MRANEVKLDRIVNILHKTKTQTDENIIFNLRISAKTILDSMSVDDRKLLNLEKDKKKIKFLIAKSNLYSFKAEMMSKKIENLIDDIAIKDKAQEIVDSL